MERLDLHGPLTFTPPAGPPLAAGALGARLDADRVSLRLRLAPSGWSRVVDHELFSAHPSVMPPGNGDFDLDQPVTLVLDLHPALTADVLALDTPAEHIAQGLATPGDPLLHTEHWRLRTASQVVDLPQATAVEGAELESGFSTVFGREHRTGYAPLPLDVAVTAALRAHGLEPIPFDETALRARVDDAVGGWTLVVMMDPGEGLCTVYSAFPRPITPDVRPHAADALTRINAQLAIGALELDEGDGQLRVRTGVDLGGPAPGVRVLERTIGHNLALMREAWATFAELAPG